MVLKFLTPWYWTPRTIGLWKETFTQSFSKFFRCYDVVFWCFSSLSGDFSDYLWYILITGTCSQISSKIAGFPSAGIFFAGVEDRSTCYAMQEGDWWMVSHEPARRQRGQIVCCLLPTPISRGDVLEAWFLVDSKCKSKRC